MSSDTPEPAVSPAQVSSPAGSIWEEAVHQPVIGLPASPSASGNSIAALVLSIASWVIFPIVLAIVALVFASKAEKEITASNGSIGGGPLVTASKIVAWVNIGVYTALVVLGILALFFLTILGVSGN
jgi:hypothetical protein|tara:strand:- start:128 stop:508 length:381 start_codon:yes stop_codon:yes gene_type:complete